MNKPITEIKSFTIGINYGEMPIRLVRHQCVEDMRIQVKSAFLDGDKGFPLEDQSLDKTHAFTVGESFEDKPRITVFIPCGLEQNRYHEVVAHEAFHVASAIIRQDLHGTMDPQNQIHISEIGGVCGVPEETVAVRVGEITTALWHMIEVLNDEIRRVAFVKGIEFDG